MQSFMKRGLQAAPSVGFYPATTVSLLAKICKVVQAWMQQGAESDVKPSWSRAPYLLDENSKKA